MKVQFKSDRYAPKFTLTTGNEDFDTDNANLLEVTGAEVAEAINNSGLGHSLFSDILKNRAKLHARMLEDFPG